MRHRTGFVVDGNRHRFGRSKVIPTQVTQQVVEGSINCLARVSSRGRVGCFDHVHLEVVGNMRVQCRVSKGDLNFHFRLPGVSIRSVPG